MVSPSISIMSLYPLICSIVSVCITFWTRQTSFSTKFWFVVVFSFRTTSDPSNAPKAVAPALPPPSPIWFPIAPPIKAPIKLSAPNLLASWFTGTLWIEHLFSFLGTFCVDYVLRTSTAVIDPVTW